MKKQLSKFEGLCHECRRKGHKFSIAFTSLKEDSLEDDVFWILDTGASDYQVNADLYFKDERVLKLAVDLKVDKKGPCMKAVKIGTIMDTSTVGREECGVALKNVLSCCPSLR